MDYDIPVAHAQPLPPPVAPGSAGMSMVFPTAQPLSDDQINQLTEQGFTRGLAKVGRPT